MKFTTPEFKATAFNCPTCGAFAHMNWFYLNNGNTRIPYRQAKCSHCDESSIWREIEQSEDSIMENRDVEAEMLYPDTGFATLPEDDMPYDVRADYIEAARIFSRSPRGAAALLRLGLQKLCKHLGEEGKNINTDIRALAAKNILPPKVIQVADTVRITGNNAVHPGEMSDDDFDHIASKMFELLNFIVKKGISEPKELDALYALIPEGPRTDAEAKDAKARTDK